MKSRERAAALLAQAGITPDGSNPWDPQIHNEHLFDRLFAGGTLALGESYMDGWWDVEDLSGFIFRLFRSDSVQQMLRIGMVPQIIKSKLFNLQNRSRARKVGEDVYDIGNDLYEAMLGPSMAYTCGYWKNASNLDEAQDAKFDFICRKLGLKSGDNILDIGCGWGNFLAYAARKYGVSGVGITISKEQITFAREVVRGLDVEIRFEDYRDTLGKFDHIVSIGMFEHVGPKNYRVFMKKVRSLLSDDGLFLLHTIGHSKVSRSLERWFNKYIFPNGHLPSITHIAKATDRRNLFDKPVLTMEDWHNFGADYDKTLTAWYANFEHSWPKLKGKYDERFYRMWKYYLLVSAGMFRARYLHLWQIVYSKNGVVGGYTSIR
ncbi:cyclopropane fatty acyl phospholipid synthase [Candidatus Kaiserbacteria bacterium]|nr:cyclopropane fatty acyl phospholipid synthase [Candidatus Kaiserbacteria bacterium]